MPLSISVEHKVLQVAVSLCWKLALPEIISVELLVGAWFRIPAAYVRLLRSCKHFSYSGIRFLLPL